MCCWWRSTTSYLAGIQVSCPYLYCNSKNSQFQHAGRFPSGNNRICDVHQADEVYLEFVLNHLHSSHKHRRFNGDSLDMTMVVPQVEVEQNSNTIRWSQASQSHCSLDLIGATWKTGMFSYQKGGLHHHTQWVGLQGQGTEAAQRSINHSDLALRGGLLQQEIFLSGGSELHHWRTSWIIPLVVVSR